MTEEFLHYLWKYRLFDQQQLTTEQGEAVEIIKPGEHNHDSGPDFFNARLRIGKTVWAGNVEIHVNSSDWQRHSHQNDGAYDNIILHVVHEADGIVKRNNGKHIPSLQLKERFNRALYEDYQKLVNNKTWIPCENQIGSVSRFTIYNFLDRLLAERLQRKSQKILEQLEANKNDWEKTFYIFLAENFGLKVNSEPFRLLALSLPVSILSKHRDDLFQIEALLFGQAGMLEKEVTDAYPQELKGEYQFLRKKFNLTPINPHIWKFMRLMPSNFPTIRLSQFAKLIYREEGLFSKILNTEKPSQLKSIFNLKCSAYWESHYRIDKKSKKIQKKLGKSAFENIMINTVAPFLFVYGIKKSDERVKERALKFLESVSAENNTIIRKWESLGVTAQSAYQSQSLLELKSEYCDKKKCLSCGIGKEVLNGRKDPRIF